MPKMAYKSVRSEALRVILAARLGMHGFANMRQPNELGVWLDSLPEHILTAYLEAHRNLPDQGFDELLLGILSFRDDERAAALVLEIAKLDPQSQEVAPTFVNETGKGSGLYHRAKSIIGGVHQYEHDNYYLPSNMLRANDPDVVAARGLVRLTHRLADGGDSGVGLRSDFTPDWQHFMYVSSEVLLRLALERPEDADRIADFVLEREVVDLELLLDYLDAPAPMMRDGIL